MKRNIPFIGIIILGLAIIWTASNGVKAEEPGTFVGAKTCGTCHGAYYEAWKAGPHGNSLGKLTEAQRHNASCLSCHVTPGTDIDQAVGCESCHGAGKYYSKPFVMHDHPAAEAAGLKIADPESCKQCHREEHPTLRKFDGTADWKKLPHAKVSEMLKKKQEKVETKNQNDK